MLTLSTQWIHSKSPAYWLCQQVHSQVTCLGVSCSFISPLVGRLHIIAEAVGVCRDIARHLRSECRLLAVLHAVPCERMHEQDTNGAVTRVRTGCHSTSHSPSPAGAHTFRPPQLQDAHLCTVNVPHVKAESAVRVVPRQADSPDRLPHDSHATHTGGKHTNHDWRPNTIDRTKPEAAHSSKTCASVQSEGKGVAPAPAPVPLHECHTTLE